jgi:hypothetical protein
MQVSRNLNKESLCQPQTQEAAFPHANPQECNVGLRCTASLAWLGNLRLREIRTWRNGGVETLPVFLECGFVLLGSNGMTFDPIHGLQELLRKETPQVWCQPGHNILADLQAQWRTLFSEVRVSPAN